ncbi:MAG: NAD-dependent epimerase/dehydratase family protein [Vicinamibacteria bacterium]|nr:NAD-dependent epimerase/dehydratase family protein [Vicinamibacteria bacterium]
MKVALTGASGYTGGRLLKALLSRGDSVKALVRPSSITPELLASGAEIVPGILGGEGDARGLVSGCDAVMHVAAVYRTAGHPDDYYRKVNVEGTQKLLEAAGQAGVKRFVHTSTVGVHGHVESRLADEDAPIAPSDIYQESKAEAEVRAREFGRSQGLPVTIVRPAAIYGPGETRLLKIFRSISRGRYAVVGTGTPHYHLVYIDDLVAGFLLALDRREAANETFILAGPRSLSQDDLAREVAKATGGSVWPFHVPAWPIQRLGDLVEALCVPLGLEPPIHRRRVDFWVKNRSFSIDKARRLLGYEPEVDVEEGISRTARWYRENGWL